MVDSRGAHGFRLETEAHYKEAVERVIAAMHQNLDQEMSLENMAEVAIMSPFHLNRVFRQLTGVPPCRFLTALRLAAAKRLLLTSSLSVTEVSLEVGYSSLGTFTRRFTELVGVSPGRFRGLIKSGARPAINNLRQNLDAARWEPQAGGVSGSIEVPEGFSGPIFVGFFTTAVPQCKPLACSIRLQAGDFRLNSLPDGKYYLMSVGLNWSLDARDYLLYDKALRGGASGIPVEIEEGRPRGSMSVNLRPPEAVDPPILMTLPLLLTGKPTSSRPKASESGNATEAAVGQ